MPLATFFSQILILHIATVALSGGLFAVRGGLGLAGQNHVVRHWSLRYFSYFNDSVLLAAGLSLAFIIHQYPLLDAWLTVKLVLLVVYIALGMLALRPARSWRQRAIAYGGALATYAFIISVAVTQNPWGVLLLLRP